MNAIEEEFKNKFKDLELSNEEFDTERLWGKISTDLNNPSSHWKRFIKIPLFLLSILLVTGLVYISYDNLHQSETTPISTDIFSNKTVEANNEKKTNLPSASLKNQSLKPSQSDSSSTHTSYRTRMKTKANKPSNISSNTISVTSLSSDSETKSSPSKNTAKKIYIEDEKKISKPSNESIQPSSDSLSTKEKSDSPNSKKNTDKFVQVFLPNQAKSILDSVISLPSLAPITLKRLKPESITLRPRYIQKHDSDEKEKARQVALIISGWAGANLTKFNFSSENLSELATTKNETESGRAGYSLGLSASLLIKDRFIIKTGVDYDQLITKFDFEQTDVNAVLRENQLLRVWIDAASGDTIRTQNGEGLVDQTTTRTVLYYNSFRRINIPLELGIKKNIHRLQIGISAGGILSFIRQQSGRTLDDLENIIQITNEEPTALLKAVNLGFRISPFVGYSLSEHWSANFRPQWTTRTQNVFEGSGIKLRSNVLSFNLGLSYHLN